MKYDVEIAAIRLSVRELCERALIAGDLDLRPGMSRRPSFERAAVGAAVHRKLQKEAGKAYFAEVSLSNTTLYQGISYEVSGRADGIIETDPVTVDEIKTVSRRAFSKPPRVLFDAQVKCYAYFLAKKRNLSHVQTRLTYYCTEDDSIRYVNETHSVEALEQFYLGLLSRIEYRAQILLERETVLRPSVGSARFPYSSVREGQDIMIRECYRDIRAGKRLFIEAPTGTGKTLSALYPAMRALGEGHCEKIFYLTAKAAARREAYRAAAQLFRAGTHLRTVVVTAREQVCRNAAACADEAGVSRHCNPLDCPYAAGFYDRLGAALCDALGSGNGFERTAILSIAQKHGICPYEFQLELSELCDLIICDYNYVFDPVVYFRRYFEDDAVSQNKYVFLIDEAHNLADRAVDMYSATLSTADLLRLWELLPPGEETLHRAIEKLTLPMQGFRRLCSDNLFRDEAGVEHGYYVNRQPMEAFHQSVGEVRTVLEAWMRSHRGDEVEVEVFRLCKTLKHFEVIAEQYDERFLTFLELSGEERTLRLCCLDPSKILSRCLSRAHAAVLFSATLTPSDYFADILGGGKDAIRVSLPSPFSTSQFALCAVKGVSTRYEDRTRSYAKIATLIAATVVGKPGNYIVYFPSYQYMEEVLKRFQAKHPKVPVVVQTRGMNAAQKDAFLNSFRDDHRLRVGFCVLGGSFSEGIDLPGGQLIGTVIVGTGLPGISNERNILRDFYETTRERGYDYAYTYPGMNRVLQAAGRVIRREEDRGVIVLIDDRYADPRYTALFPDHWSGIQYAENSAELAEIVAEFWKNQKNND